MDRCLEIEVFMISLGSVLLIKIGLIMKKLIRKSMLDRKAMVYMRFNKKSEKKGTTPKE